MKLLDNLAPHSHWLLRIALASVFLYHGLTKFTMLSQMAEMMQKPVAMVVMVALFETFGALLVLSGGFLSDWMTRVGALLICPIMLGAIIMVHWGQWSFMASESHPAGGIEFQTVLLLIAVYLLIKGNNVKDGKVGSDD